VDNDFQAILRTFFFYLDYNFDLHCTYLSQRSHHIYSPSIKSVIRSRINKHNKYVLGANSTDRGVTLLQTCLQQRPAPLLPISYLKHVFNIARTKTLSALKHVKHELETMLVGSTNQCNLLSSLGSVLNALSLPRTAFFRWVSEVFGLLRERLFGQ
jgi:hypothetical protein